MKNRLIRKPIGMIAALAIALTAISPSAFAETSVRTESGAVVSELGTSYGTMRGLTALQLVNDMGAGWNLGNSLEASGGETAWGNPKTTKEMIDKIAAAGFTTLRIPVRWDQNYTDSDYTINPDFLKRVEEVVNYGLDNGMYVILNIHHNELQTKVTTDTSVQEQVCYELSRIWTQVGTYFRDYGDKLIFETNNEPRADEDWSGNDAYYDCVNLYNEAARSAIRATGGNNAKRLVTMPTYCASADEAKIRGWEKEATDDMVAVSLHAYLPYDFAFEGSGHSDWQTSDDAELAALFDRIDKCFLSKGIPVIMDEFGAVNKNNTSTREEYANKYIAAARKFAEQDIPCVWWDNNAFNVGAENFGIFNRSALTFTYPTIAQYLTEGYDGDPAAETACSAKTVYFSETKTTGGNYTGSINIPTNAVTALNEGEYLCAAYSSANQPELILQSWSAPSSQWVKVNPDECSNGIAKWSYNTLVNSAYPYENYGYLDAVLIGDTGDALTLSEVYVNNDSAHTHVYNGAENVTIPATETTYGRKVIYCSVDGCSAYKVVKTDKVTESPKPTIVAYKVGDCKVKLEWTAIDGAEMYRVYSYSDGVYTRQFTCLGTRNIATVTGLEGGKEYGFVVSAKVNGTWTDYSDKGDLLYATPTGTPKPSIVGYKVGNYKVKLEWRAVDGAEMYRVYTYEDGVYTRKFTCLGSRNIATVTGLVSGTNYGFVVSAKVNGSWTDYTDPDDLVYATPTGDPAPVITGYTTGDGKVKLAWYALDGAEMYRVYSLLNGVYTRQFTTYTSTTATVTGLENGTEYGFVVSAKVDGTWTAYNVPELILYATPNA